MSDVILVAATIAFFAICVLYIHWCDKIIGPDDFRASADGTTEAGPSLGEGTPLVVSHVVGAGSEASA